MAYDYDRSRRASTKAKTQKLREEVEKFLYPEWYKGSGYRGDIRYSPEMRELQEFYQSDSDPSADELGFLERYLAKVKVVTDAEWARDRKDALESIRELDDPSNFRASDLRKVDSKAAMKLDHLVGEGDVERNGSFFSLKR